MGKLDINQTSRDECIFCFSTLPDPFLTLREFPVYMGTTSTDAKYDLYANQNWAQCNACNAVQLKNLIPTSILYSENHSEPVGKTWTDHHESFSQFILRELNPSASVVEIGGASGTLARLLLSKHEFDYLMIEPDAQEKVVGVRFIKGFIEDHLDHLTQADAVIHSHVLEHLYNPLSTMESIAKKMKMGSKMFISFPNIEELLRSGGSNALNFEHTYFANLENLEWMLKVCDLELIQLQSFGNHSYFMAAQKIGSEVKVATPQFVFSDGARNLLVKSWGKIEKVARSFNDALISSQKSKGYIFGAHIFAQGLINQGLIESNCTGILDNAKSKQGLRLYGTNLYTFTPEILAHEEHPIVALVASHYQEEIKSQLLSINQNVQIVED